MPLCVHFDHMEIFFMQKSENSYFYFLVLKFLVNFCPNFEFDMMLRVCREGERKAKEPFQGVGKCKETEVETGKFALSKFVKV